MTNSRSELKVGAIISYLTVAFNCLSGLLYTPWLIRSIGTSDYALYTLSVSIVTFFVMDFGLNDSVSRYLSNYYASSKESFVPDFLGIVYKLFFILSAIIAALLLLVYFFSDSIYASLGQQRLEIFKRLYLVVSLYSVISLPFMPMRGILTANERFISLNACLLGQKVLTVLLIVASILSGAGVYALVCVNAGCLLVSSLVQWLLVRSLCHTSANLCYWDGRVAKSIFNFSLWITVAQVCQRMIFSIAPSVIAALSTTWEVTIFGLASSMESYVYSIAAALNGMFMPRVANSLAKGGNELYRLLVKVGRIQLYIIGFAIIAFISFGMRFITCWMDSSYSEVYPCVLLIIMPMIIELPFAIGDTALISSGVVRIRSCSYLLMAIANVIGMLALTPSMGALGACVSIFIAYMLRTGIKLWLYRTRLGISLWKTINSIYLKWIIVSIPLTLLFTSISRLVLLHGWLSLLCLGVPATIVYFIAMYVFVMDESERQLLTTFRR